MDIIIRNITLKHILTEEYFKIISEEDLSEVICFGLVYSGYLRIPGAHSAKKAKFLKNLFKDGDTVKSTVLAFLMLGRYDGLYNEIGCACKLDDLMPCEFTSGSCKAGIFVPCSGEYSDSDFCIGKK